MIYKMKLADSVDEMTFDLLEVPIEDKDVEGTADNTTIDGNVFTDYLWLKKQFVQKWSLMCEDDYTQLRGFYTRQWENAEVPTYKLYYGDDISTDNTLSGDYITLTNNTDYNAPILDFELDGNATQQTYSGKNLLPYPYRETTTTRNGITYTVNADQSITVNGTASSASYFVLQSNGSYGSTGIDGSHTGTNGLYAVPITSASNSPYMYFNPNNRILSLSVNSGVSLNNYIYRPIIASGTVVGDYEPYVGGTASPNPSYPQNIDVVSGEQTVKIEGKNLFDKNAITSGKLIDRNTGALNDNVSYATSDFIPVKAGEQYTYTGFNYWYACGFNSAKEWISLLSNTATITIPDGVSYIRAGLLVANLDTAQFEQNSQATAYEPYQAQEYPIDLGSIELAKIGNYQDRIYKDDGKWYIEKQVGKVLLNGSEIWNVSGTNYYTSILQNVVAPTPMTEHYLGLSNYFEVVGFNYQSDTNLFFHPNKNLQVKNTNWATLNDWTTWLSTHPTTVYYALATPTTTEITEQALIDQLEAIVNATLPTGENNIMLIPSMGAQGSMEIEYKLIISQETIIYNTTPVRLNLTDGGVINPCGCRQNVQLTMRETIQ